MREWLVDLAIGVGIAALIVLIALLSSFSSTFIYQGF